MAKKRTYVQKDDKVYCFQEDDEKCKVINVHEAKTLTTFHDADLAQATKEIHAILEEVGRANRDLDRELAFLRTPDGLFLAWTVHAIGPEDEEEEIKKALGLQ